MLKHYIKFAIRNFRSNKVIFAGSLATLCLGALCISLLFSYVHNELTMDDFHERKQDIYMIINQTSPESKPSAIDARSFFGFDYKDYPELENSTTIRKYPSETMKFTYGENVFSPEGIVVDSSFFKVFDFELKVGDKENILSDPDAVLVTETFAKKMFGSEDPIGKNVKVTSTFEDIYTVKGIVNKAPSNSSITYDFILPYDKEPNKHNRNGAVFILANKNFNKANFEKKIEKIAQKHEQFGDSKTNVVAFSALYFNKDAIEVGGIVSRFGDENVIQTLILIMLVILIISALNFSNLQIINTNTTLKQLAISTVNGANKQQLLTQKLVEIILLLGLSVVIISLGYNLILPVFNEFTRVEIAPSLSEILIINSSVLSVLVCLALIYPLFTIAKRPLLSNLKPQSFSGTQLVGRKFITVLQYTLTFILLIASVIVVKQLNMMLDQDLGFTSKNIISTKLFSRIPFPLKNSDFDNYGDKQDFYKKKKAEYDSKKAEQESNYQYVKNELTSHPSIANLSQGVSPLTPFASPWKVKRAGNEYTSENLISVDFDYEKVFDLEITEGRFFELGRDEPNGKQVVINEAAKKFWNIQDFSKSLLLNKFWDDKDGYEIIGVVKNFNYEHLSSKPKPLLMSYWGYMEQDFLIQFQDDKVQEGLQFVESLFNKVNPNQTFSYTFLSDDIATLYQKEKQLSTIYIVFTIIALLISAIGLFTIALYDTQRRVKEIGIRKVNGATVNEIMLMLNKDFIKWVIIAFIISCPIAYYAMHKWLENFAYKTSLSWWVFALAGVFTLVIALVTVSWQTYRAARRNPVESLRDE
ncbi:ABC transporter permease [Gelidibacter salicanalis]|uniref:ABC transporter permease n=1 Tax=Gelidibacter salicanalis TaxID=291193 RepID=A0A934NGH8_9FLAO|nr:ABC transporter permease [Gelidibacter salicanalis]MBJ7879616.1 ABC transporter permease [Gelidibacter salicanalis]